jgi:ubiquinone/menaquinone biosynthesis C-methylase UbiE
MAQEFGCSVIGVDLSAQNVARAAAEADRQGLTGRVEFRIGDAEHLALEDRSADAIVCECAFCTFPDKPRAAREFGRVLRPRGRIGISDITRTPGPPGELDDLMAWITCLADARPATTYAELLTASGFEELTIEVHDEALIEMIRGIGTKLFATEVLAGLDKIALAGIDLTEAKRLTSRALTAALQKRLGYAIVHGLKS